MALYKFYLLTYDIIRKINCSDLLQYTLFQKQVHCVQKKKHPLMFSVVSRFRAAQFRAAQFRAAQSRAAHFSAVHCVLRTGPSRGGKGGKFSRAPRRLGALPSLKNTENGVPDGSF